MDNQKPNFVSIVFASSYIRPGLILGSVDNLDLNLFMRHTLHFEPAVNDSLPKRFFSISQENNEQLLVQSFPVSKSHLEEENMAWLENLQASPDCYVQNVAIWPNQITDSTFDQTRVVMVTCRPIESGSMLFAWFSPIAAMTYNLPILSSFNIRNHSCYRCDECDKQYSSPNYLKAHMFLERQAKMEAEQEDSDSSSNERQPEEVSNFMKMHKCPFCGRYYSRKYGLRIHIRTHTGFKPLQCRFCNRRFGDPSNLNKHLKLHRSSS
ncbi:hypothetical protein Ciccas_008146 [Cichlidogyrus casuarinus]|uniref:C2H2-type domain-containing protein n=1 Tax=Cichlidogyrus casuarinus TaxID=1844966 RepID=A0ABD2Q146_9PLAT